VPMVGWKHAPLSAITSRFLVSDKYFHTLCTEMEMVIEYIHMFMTNFCIE
jgi:hypothetical protein